MSRIGVRVTTGRSAIGLTRSEVDAAVSGYSQGPPGAGVIPARLAIYYGYPSLVNGASGDLAAATAAFAPYDVVVLGDGLEFSSGSTEYEFTLSLMAALHATARQPRFYGYIDLGSTQALSDVEVAARISQWATMGVDGIFFDEAGYDFGVTRERQNLAVTAVHTAGLRTILNAWNPDDLVNPIDGDPVLRASDAILLESFAVSPTMDETLTHLNTRIAAAVAGRQTLGVSIYAVSTSADATDINLLAYAWWAATAAGLDGYGWGMPNFSATSNALPYLNRPQPETVLSTASFTGALLESESRWQRATSLGLITVDHALHLGWIAFGSARTTHGTSVSRRGITRIVDIG